jgi:hypothetical protein
LTLVFEMLKTDHFLQIGHLMNLEFPSLNEVSDPPGRYA